MCVRLQYIYNVISSSLRNLSMSKTGCVYSVIVRGVSCVSCVPASCFYIWFWSTCYSRCVYLALCYPDVVIKDYSLKYVLVCVFLVSPCCVHRDRRPDQTVSVVPSPRFVLFVFSSVCLFLSFVPRGKRVRSPQALMPAVRGSLRRRALPGRVRRCSHPTVRGSLRRRSRLSHPAVRGS